MPSPPPPPPPPPSPLTPAPSTEQPTTFVELANRLQTLLVKNDAPQPLTPSRGGTPSSTVNATSLLNRSMQQLVVTTLMRSPSSKNLSQPTTPRSYSSSPSVHSPECSQLPITPMSRRSSYSESLYSFNERSETGDDLNSEAGEDTANWKDTWRSVSSTSSDSSRKKSSGLLLAKRFPGDSRVRSIRQPLELAAATSDPIEENVYEYSKSDHHVVDVQPDPNDSP